MSIKIKDENYFTVQGFMVNKLHLKGNELMAYAIIYGFSQNDEDFFEGSIAYVASWLNVARSTVQETLTILVDKGLLIKKDIIKNSVKFCNYKAIIPDDETINRYLSKEWKKERKDKKKQKQDKKECTNTEKRYTCTENQYGVYRNSVQGIPKISMGGIPKFGHHIDIDINSNNINDTIESNDSEYVLPLKDGQKNIYAFSEKKEQKNSDEDDEEEYQTTDEKLKYEIFPEIDDYMEKNYEYEYENGMNLVLEDIITEFYHQYFMRFAKKHRIMKIDTYKKIVDKYFLPPECMEDVYDFKSYKSMIECYFKTNYNKRGNYNGKIQLSLAHFFSENILKNLYHKIQC